jgi:hypothetical protein
MHLGSGERRRPNSFHLLPGFSQAVCISCWEGCSPGSSPGSPCRLQRAFYYTRRLITICSLAATPSYWGSAEVVKVVKPSIRLLRVSADVSCRVIAFLVADLTQHLGLYHLHEHEPLERKPCPNTPRKNRYTAGASSPPSKIRKRCDVALPRPNPRQITSRRLYSERKRSERRTTSGRRSGGIRRRVESGELKPQYLRGSECDILNMEDFGVARALVVQVNMFGNGAMPICHRRLG